MKASSRSHRLRTYRHKSFFSHSSCSLQMQKSEVPRPTTKRRASHAKNSWSIDETVLALFLRSRRVTDAAILIILNERYTPKVRQLGAIRNKLQFLRISEEKAGRIDLTNDKYFTRPENVDNWIRSQRSDTHKRWSDLLTFTEHEHEVMGGVSQHKNPSLCTYTKETTIGPASNVL